jgi:hypothetical protein
VLLDPYGRLARRQTLPLMAPAIRALVDGREFLRSLSTHLAAIRVVPYCRRCVATGGVGEVSVRMAPDHVEFRCAHTAGRVKMDKPLEVEPLLDALNWGLRCQDCGGPVQGDNGKADLRFQVQCDCTIREMANPLATRTTGPLG